MAIQDHDWFSIIIGEIFAWTCLYWWGGGRFHLLVQAIDGKAGVVGTSAASGHWGSTKSGTNPAGSGTPSPSITGLVSPTNPAGGSGLLR